MYAEVLFRARMYSPAARFYETALAIVPKDGTPFSSAQTARRIVTDQLGMAYGMTGDLTKARTVFEQGIKEDSAYPMYYYNLACADAGNKDLTNARLHLQQAFDRKANVVQGEALPDPTKDDSFLPFRGEQDFWGFLTTLNASR